MCVQSAVTYNVQFAVCSDLGSLCAQSGSDVNITGPVKHMQSEHHRQCNKHMHKYMVDRLGHERREN